MPNRRTRKLTLLPAVLMLLTLMCTGCAHTTVLSDGFTRGTERFAVQLTEKQIKSRGAQDFCISPMGVYITLTMAASGIGEDAASELAGVLGGLYPAECKSYAGILYRSRSAGAASAFALYPKGKAVISRENPSFLREVRLFGASVLDADEKSVNRWLKKAGDEPYPYEPSDSPDTVMDILNYIRFSSGWLQPFAVQPASAIFTREDGSQIQAVCMICRTSCRYRFEERYTRVSVPLEKGRAFFILPAEGCGISDIPLSEALPEYGQKYGTVELTLPKFACQYQQDLSAELAQMGLQRFFSPGALGLAGLEDGRIGAVGQSCRIEIDEAGVSASAPASERIESAPAGEVPAVVFDRPFVFGVCDADNRILFTGVCAMD